MGQAKPFTQQPYGEIPSVPRLPHAYALTQPCDLDMVSEGYGPLRIHYRSLGEGPPLLLVHGLMTSSYSWRYVAASLARDFRVIIPDLPGAGRSDKPRHCSFAPEPLSRWIGEFQAALDIRGCLAVGNSLGGYLCMREALRDPGAFRRLVNIHSPAVPLARLWVLRFGLSLPGVFRALERRIRRDPYRWVHRFVKYFDETLKSQEEAHAYGTPLASSDGARCFLRCLQEACDPMAFRAFVQQLEARVLAQQPFPVPLQLVYARQDPMVPPHVGARLQALVPDADFVWMTGTSHFAHVETPERFIDVVRPFLQAGIGQTRP
ncbi:MAG: alpha/beta hydrolase [Candidatus Sericytochromatia bacterium]|nr:alpha/beta hydrolase [Candidatus Sericytochromatia bacterium]